MYVNFTVLNESFVSQYVDRSEDVKDCQKIPTDEVEAKMSLV